MAFLFAPAGQTTSLFKRDGKRITLQPGLTAASLDAIAAKVEAAIVEMYATCEAQFQTGVKLLDAVVQYQYQETAGRREAALTSDLNAARAASMSGRT